MKPQFFIISAALSAIFIACGTQQQATTNGKGTQTHTTADNSKRKAELTFVEKVSDNAVYTKNISSKINFNLKKGDRDISVDGQIHMRRDEVIRIQLAPLGLVEVGRIEMTPQYVLILIRPTKEYIKATYNEIDFLRRNGLNFYSLQALFWNQLFMPGTQRVSQQMLEQFAAELTNAENNVPVKLEDGKMKYQWTADKNTGRITQTDAVYQSGTNGQSSLKWKYSNFTAVGTKQYPQNHSFTLTANDEMGKKTSFSVALKMKKIDTNGDFETNTSVSSKYKQITVEQAIKRLTSL